MKAVTGTFLGTGAILSLGIGFKPDFVRVFNITSATLESIEWNKGMAGVTAIAEGIKRSGDVAVADSKLVATAGISEFSGGNKITGAQTTYLVAGGTTYEFEAAAAGDVIPDGFTLAADADVNANAEVCYFEAGCYDN